MLMTSSSADVSWWSYQPKLDFLDSLFLLANIIPIISIFYDWQFRGCESFANDFYPVVRSFNKQVGHTTIIKIVSNVEEAPVFKSEELNQMYNLISEEAVKTTT